MLKTERGSDEAGVSSMSWLRQATTDLTRRVGFFSRVLSVDINKSFMEHNFKVYHRALLLPFLNIVINFFAPRSPLSTATSPFWQFLFGGKNSSIWFLKNI